MSETTHRAPDTIAVSDHLRPAARDTRLDSGVYRVVGTSEDAVTLLRVTGADGRRAHTGEVHTVLPPELDSLEPAENPDENQSVTAVVASQLDGLAWQLRLIGRTVIERPVPGALALALVAVGLFGDQFVPMPGAVDTLLFLAGALSLLYLSKASGSR